MTKQEAIEQARKEVLEHIENQCIISGWKVKNDQVSYLIEDEDIKTVISRQFEPEMIPNVTRCEVWDDSRPEHPIRCLFSGYRLNGEATFHWHSTTVTFDNYEIIPPDTELETAMGRIADWMGSPAACRACEAISKTCRTAQIANMLKIARGEG